MFFGGFGQQCLEVEHGLAILVLSAVDDATVADVDVDAVVGLDAVDGLQLGTAALGQLPVGTAVEDGAFQTRSLKGSASDGYHRAFAVGVSRLPYRPGLTILSTA